MMLKKGIDGKNRILEYDVLRVILTFLVIIGHASYISIKTDYGGIDYSRTFCAENAALMMSALNEIKKAIYRFHMPLFFALSGALFRKTMMSPTVSLTEVIKSKIKRLLIPFLCVSLFYSFPLKLISVVL